MGLSSNGWKLFDIWEGFSNFLQDENGFSPESVQTLTPGVIRGFLIK